MAKPSLKKSHVKQFLEAYICRAPSFILHSQKPASKNCACPRVPSAASLYLNEKGKIYS